MEESYGDHADYYCRGPYARYLVERRAAGSETISLFTAAQPAGSYPDPAFPNMLLYVARKGAKEARFDWGAGTWRGRWWTGHLTLVPPDSASDVTLSERHEFLALCIPKAVLGASAEDDGPDLSEALAPLFAAPFRDRLVTTLCAEIWREAQEDNPQGALFVDHAMLCLLARLARLSAGPAHAGGAAGLPAPLLRRVIDHIEANLSANVTIAELSAIAGLSPAHFARRFRRTVGQPPYRFVLERRLERAKDLLSSQEASVAQIAAATGFSSQSHLSDKFKRQFGTTPAAFVKERAKVRSAGR